VETGLRRGSGGVELSARRGGGEVAVNAGDDEWGGCENVGFIPKLWMMRVRFDRG